MKEPLNENRVASEATGKKLTGAKRSYESPDLTKYGDITDLTLSVGSAGAIDAFFIGSSDPT